MFNGDASKIVYGFCIHDWGPFNLESTQASEVMEWLSEKYPCNGGVFFWAANNDVNENWSKVVKNQLAINNISCSTTIPVNPTNAPVFVYPVANPTSAPIVGSNVDGSTSCKPIPQDKLPTGSWKTPNDACALCETGYIYWPCDLSPPLCQCGDDIVPIHGPSIIVTPALAPFALTSPTRQPTKVPLLPIPTALPTKQCRPNSSKVVYIHKRKNKKCNWIKAVKTRKNRCKKLCKGKKIKQNCPVACGKFAGMGICKYLWLKKYKKDYYTQCLYILL